VAESTLPHADTFSGRGQRAATDSPRRLAEGIALAVLGLVAQDLLSTASLAAQGVTGAAMHGVVVSENSTPVEQATVHVTNTSSGERWQTTTRARGRYFIEYLSVGGPYRIEVRAVGYEPAQRDSIFLALGQRLTANFTLTLAVLELEEVSVTGIEDPRLSGARTGPSQIVSDSTIGRLPVNHRDYTELALLSPQVTKSPNNGLSFAGLHDRFNRIQVDGTNNNDPFGNRRSGNGTPGWAVGLTAFTPEAVKELQIVAAPFDVRYGSFAGGLINAVTRSGSNRVEGSILGHFEGSDLSGATSTANQGADFTNKELGLTFGAPIVRDRVALFVNAALGQEVIPQSVHAPSSDTTGGADSAGVGIRYESLVRFQNILRSYGVEPGSFSAGATRTPTRNLFIKVTAQLGVNSRLAVSHNYGHGNAQHEAADRIPGSYTLSSTGSENPETINATRLAWSTAFGGRFSNELILARVDDRRTCHPNSSFPTVSVLADEGELLAGVMPACLGLETGHTMWEITDNFGLAAGNHRLTLGTHAERIDMVDDVLIFPAGVWFFDDLESLEQGKASRYIRDFPIAADSQAAFRINQIGGYVQDQWQPTPWLTLTLGLRFDVPFVPKAPTQNPTALEELGINTALTPSGNVLWSPRFGVNYDPSGRGTTLLRGGAGFFSGHPAYVWFRNVYGTTGFRSLSINCEAGAVPEFTLDPGNQPTACAEPVPSTFPLAYFDPEFRFPRTLKVALGADRLLPGGVVGTVDFLYTRTVNAVHVADVNLVGPKGISAGEGGRVLYGTVDSIGIATPNRKTEALQGVYQLRNGSGDRSYSVTVQLEKRFHASAEVSAAYTYTDAKDRMSMEANIANFNAGSTPVNGTLEQRELRTSLWGRPHKVTLVGTTDLPLGFRLGLTYVGVSGAPYTYVLLGDPNADGFLPFDVSNDVVYVPRDAGDITLADPAADWPLLDRYIRNEPCLESQRGRLLERNSCRDPWVHETSARLSKRFRLGGRRVLELTADMFNVLNFVDSDWGLVRQTSVATGNLVPLMEIVGYDAPNDRGVYALVPVYPRQLDVNASGWRLQLGTALSF
jgi:carboxypeptidase family protein